LIEMEVVTFEDVQRHQRNASLWGGTITLLMEKVLISDFVYQVTFLVLNENL